MKDIYLHVGYHKTGTTAIQNFMFKNRNLVLSNGILYPKVGLSGAGHSKLANVFKGDEWGKVVKLLSPRGCDTSKDIYALEPGENEKSLYSALKYEIEKSEASKVVLSSECFLEWIDPWLIKEALNDISSSVKVIFYLREPKEWIESVYYQLVKDRYFRYSGRIEDLPQWEMLDYDSVLTRWATVFGSDNLIVRQYESTKSLEHGVISDFMNIIDMPVVHIYKYPKTVEDLNLGLHPLLIKVLKYINKLNMPESSHRRVLNILFPISYFLFKIKV